MALHGLGASPRSFPRKAILVLERALALCGLSTQAAELLRSMPSQLSPVVQEFDDALIALVQRPRSGRYLIQGQWGNWGQTEAVSAACHPAFRECRLSPDGQTLVLEALGFEPDPIHDPILGRLIWNRAECWWEGKVEAPSGATVQVAIAIYQDVPGTHLDLSAARQTLAAIRGGELRIRQAIAGEALKPDRLAYPDEFKPPPLITQHELETCLRLCRIVLNAGGGARIVYVVNGWDGCEIEVWVTVEGRVEDIWVYA